MRDLKRYRAKRDPERSPEPFGDERSAPAREPGAPRQMVVQQHAARRLHWDLRLEIEDVLVSWAVPRGPILDPRARRLAVRTEDHPLEYADFEGLIPAGSYGAGAMILWDSGSYRTVDGRAPAEGLESGKLDLWLAGHKLRGRFALVRTRRSEGRDWLLLYKGAEPVDGPEITQRQPESVVSGLTVEELRDGVRRDAELASAARAAGAPRRRLDAAALRPMLATRGDEPFSREGWLFELKYDGVRVLLSKRDRELRLFARSGGERSAVYPELVRAARHLPVADCLLDGEIVALDERGRASFERIQRRFTQVDPELVARLVHEVPVVLFAFDLLGVAGCDLRGLPLHRRKQLLAQLAPPRGPLRLADHVEGDGLALLRVAERHGLEGVVAKRADSRYEAGRRSTSWLKWKLPRRAQLAIVGVVPGRGSRRALGSLMLAWRSKGSDGLEGEGLRYAGNVGSGLSEAAIDRLLPELEGERIDAPAFRGAPAPRPRGSFYVRPSRVCELHYTEVTEAGLLRQPVFRGLLEDAEPSAFPGPTAPAAERDAPPASAEPPAPELSLSRQDKIFWPVEGYTKGDLLRYYEAVWPWLAPYLRDRPVVLTRYPDGIEGKHFYQKNAPDFTPEWALRERIDQTDYFVCNDLRTLLYVVNSGAIPLHVWSARIVDLERPDWLILDLDPKQAPFARVVELARGLRRLLDALGARHFWKTSGQDGLHVLLPLAGVLDHADARRLAELLARVVCAEHPALATVARPLAARGQRVYVDALQNGRGKLIASPLSVRPRPGAPVSMPLTPRQLNARLDPGRFTIATAVARLRRGGDPMAGVLGDPVQVDELLEALLERLDPEAPGAGG